MQHIKQAIKILLKKTGLEGGVKQQEVINVWEEVVGDKVSQNTSPEKVESGTLYIKTSNPTWRQELVFKKSDIIKKLNNKLGKNTIKEIKFIWTKPTKAIALKT